MSIYKLRYKLKTFLSVHIDSVEMREKMGKVIYPNGESLTSQWKPVEGRFYNQFDNSDNGKMPEISDWAGNMVLSPKAYQILKTPLSDFGEFLPVTLNSEQWHIFNTTHIQNEIDHSDSENEVMDGMIMGVSKLKFHDSKLKDVLISRTDFDRRMSVFANDKFKKLIEGHHFEEILFREDLVSPF